MKPEVPEGYFDATTLLKEVKHPKYVKVSQFLDSEEVKNLLTTLHDYKKSQGGCCGYTYLKDELRPLFNQWLLAVGNGRGRKVVQS